MRCLFACLFLTVVTRADELPLTNIRLPPGFRISVFASDIPNARSMTLGEQGTVFVGTRDEDKVYALVDSNKDGKVDATYIVAKDLDTPNGVAFKNGALYIAEINRIWRLDGIDSRLKDPPKPLLVTERLPSDMHHGWKFIAFGPDSKLYVPVGAPCNICEKEDPRYAAILRMNPDGSDIQVFASGIRNTVGFDWRPGTSELWFTDNGRDMLGDDRPADELNRAWRHGMHFGYPYCHAGDIADPEFGIKKSCASFVAPARKLGPHVAALGMRFYRGKMFPEPYRGRIFIAEHGSWNRSTPLGYRIMTVAVKDGKATSYNVFAEGWLKDGKAWGRPVDVQELPDGSLLVSDDKAGVIYRISR